MSVDPVRLAPWRRALLWALLVASAALGTWHWVRMGTPVELAEPGADRLDCVSYAPFRRPGETPFDPTARVDEARLEADLRLLSQRTGCVRTYSVSQGLDAVPRVARRLGMTVLLGAWLGRDRRENEAEMTAAIALAREHADVVRALVVGNEVMLRREMPEAELVAHIERARREVPVPVTYADVWEFWLQHPTIAPAVSFVTIHILPYWEDHPVGIDAAIAHVLEVHDDMRRRMPGKDILIGETGWPSEGRARRDAVPGRVEQARFARQFSRVAAERGLRYNFIEGFDQPWKRTLEGAMGGAWGLLDSEGVPKFDWHGPVAPRERWRHGLWAALGGAWAGAVMLAAIGRRRGAWTHAAVGALAGAAIAAVLVEQLRYLVVWNRFRGEWLASGAWTAIATAACATSAAWLARRLAGERGAAVLEWPGMAAVLRDALRGRMPRLEGWASLLQGAVAFGAALVVVLHAFDARYRGFPWPLFAPPAVAALGVWLAGARRVRDAVEERWLAGALVAGAAIMVAFERPSNAQAVAYAALTLVLAGCVAARTSTSSPSRAPAPAGSKL